MSNDLSTMSAGRKRKASVTADNEQLASKTLKQTHTTRAAPAVEQVFVTPELIERILEHVSVNQLFALRRVNSTFNGTTGLQKFNKTMFLQPIPQLRLFHLTKLLTGKRLRKAMHPFYVTGIHTRSQADHYSEPPGPKLMLCLALDRGWCDGKRVEDDKREGSFFDDQLVCKQRSSWQDIWICSGELSSLRVTLGQSDAFNYEAGQCVRLGEVVERSMRRI